MGAASAVGLPSPGDRGDFVARAFGLAGLARLPIISARNLPNSEVFDGVFLSTCVDDATGVAAGAGSLMPDRVADATADCSGVSTFTGCILGLGGFAGFPIISAQNLLNQEPLGRDFLSTRAVVDAAAMRAAGAFVPEHAVADGPTDCSVVSTLTASRFDLAGFAGFPIISAQNLLNQEPFAVFSGGLILDSACGPA